MQCEPDLKRITRDPAVLLGRPCIRGIRIGVSTILGLLASGASEQEVIETYPFIEAEDIRAALAYAALRCNEQEILLVPAS